METLQTLEVRRVPSSADLMQAGDYCFIGKREPIRRFEPVENGQQLNFFQRLFGTKKILKEVIEIVWPDCLGSA